MHWQKAALLIDVPSRPIRSTKRMDNSPFSFYFILASDGSNVLFEVLKQVQGPKFLLFRAMNNHEGSTICEAPKSDVSAQVSEWVSGAWLKRTHLSVRDRESAHKFRQSGHLSYYPSPTTIWPPTRLLCPFGQFLLSVLNKILDISTRKLKFWSKLD